MLHQGQRGFQRTRKGLQVVGEVVRAIHQSRHEGYHHDPDGGKEAEQFGGAALSGAGGGEEPPVGRPTPATVEDLEVFFDSLAGVEVTGKGVLEEMVHSNAFLTNTIATLIDTNS